MYWDRSYLIKKFDVVCPIDRFVRKGTNMKISSFLQETISIEETYNNNNSKIPTSTKKNSEINEKTFKFNDETRHFAEKPISFNEKSTNFNDLDIPTDDIMLTSKLSATEKALETIARIYAIQQSSLRKNLKLSKDSELLIKQLSNLMEPLLLKDLNNEYLSNKLEVLEGHYHGTLKLFSYLTQITQIKLKYHEQENMSLKISKLKALKHEPYNEVYSTNIFEIYKIFDHPSALSGPSKWSFTKNNLLGHENAISQTSNIHCIAITGCTASVLILRYKEYFDGIIETSILLRDADIAGIVFRYKDAFNYYVFEMKQQGRGWKRIRQVIKGISQVIAYVEDGGYLQNIWYKLVVIFRSDEFIVKMAQENLHLPVESIPIVIKTENQELKKGGIGFLTNGLQGLYIDGFSVKPVDCISEPELPEIRYLPPECSRFKETYYGQMGLRWKVVNPDNFFDGPAIWDFEGEFLGKEKVIYQKTGIFSPNPEKIGTFAVLSFDKMCRNGVISIDFFAENQGIIGLAFKYVNSMYFYVVEVGGEDDKYVQIRKRIDGKYTTIAKNETIGYQLKTWHKITVVMMDSMYKVYFSNLGESPIEVFETSENKDILDGTIGLTTFKTEAAFDNIKMSPLSDWMQGNGEIHTNLQGIYIVFT